MTKPQRGTFIARVETKQGQKMTAIYASTVASAISEGRRWIRAQNMDPANYVIRIREVFKPHE